MVWIIACIASIVVVGFWVFYEAGWRNGVNATRQEAIGWNAGHYVIYRERTGETKFVWNGTSGFTPTPHSAGGE